MKCYTTNKDGVFICTEKTLEKDERIEMNLIKAYPEVRYQEVLGMGGALTEAAAGSISRKRDCRSMRSPQRPHRALRNWYRRQQLCCKPCRRSCNTRRRLPRRKNWQKMPTANLRLKWQTACTMSMPRGWNRFCGQSTWRTIPLCNTSSGCSAAAALSMHWKNRAFRKATPQTFWALHSTLCRNEVSSPHYSAELKNS